MNGLRTTQSFLENETEKLFYDFEIQTDNLISATRPEVVIINKKIVDFLVPDDHREKLKEKEKRDEYLDLAKELKINVEHESYGDSNGNWSS